MEVENQTQTNSLNSESSTWHGSARSNVSDTPPRNHRDEEIHDPDKLIEWHHFVNELAKLYPASEYAKMSPVKMEAVAGAWLTLLSDVPLNQIQHVYRRAVASMPGGFPPQFGDFKAAWDGMRSEVYQSKHESQWKEQDELRRGACSWADVAKNAPDYVRPFLLHGEAVTCNCPELPAEEIPWHGGTTIKHAARKPSAALSRDGLHWVCATAECDFRERVDELAAGKTEVQEWADERFSVPKLSDVQEQLMNDLQGRCGMQVEKVGYAAAAQFGAWLLSRYSVDLWTRELAVTQWGLWKAEQS